MLAFFLIVTFPTPSVAFSFSDFSDSKTIVYALFIFLLVAIIATSAAFYVNKPEELRPKTEFVSPKEKEEADIVIDKENSVDEYMFNSENDNYFEGNKLIPKDEMKESRLIFVDNEEEQRNAKMKEPLLEQFK